MQGKTVAVTGCTTGTGFILAKACVELGADVVMLNRHSVRNDNAKASLEALGGTGKIISVPCNLASFEAVRTAGATLRNELPNGIDVLVNNAGIMGVKDEATVDGYDIQMQTSMQLLRTLTHCACAARQPPR
jgi:NAD(P)-dependent dehydrogenase (short-subunit alcohol dehydrogenase family)